MTATESYVQDFLNAVLGALAVTVVASIIAFLSTRIFPSVRKWFDEVKVVLIVSFLMSAIVAGTIGLFLRHLTWQELAGFTIVKAGLIDPSKVSNNCKEPDAAKGFGVDKIKDKDGKDKDGEYHICLAERLPKNSFILISPIVDNTDDDTTAVSANVVTAYHDSFNTLTLRNGKAADKPFLFIVVRGRGGL